MFYPIQYKNGCLAATNLFILLSQLNPHKQLNSMRSIISYHENRCLKNVIHQIDSKNKWLLLSASLTAKFDLAFVLTLENASS